jgi:uncharacterized Fe-S cluster protein YjdI
MISNNYRYMQSKFVDCERKNYNTKVSISVDDCVIGNTETFLKKMQKEYNIKADELISRILGNLTYT